MLVEYIIISKKVNERGGEPMSTINDIMKMVKDNNGIITTSMISNAGIHRGNLQYLVKTGLLEKSDRGVYISPEVLDDEIFNLQSRFKRGIFSHETALFLWDLTDRTPNVYSMTFPSTYNLTNPKQNNINCFQCKSQWYDVGVEEVKTPSGNLVKAYNRERTLCDILRPNSLADIQIVSESFKQYVERKDRNIPLLSEYARLFKVDNKLRSYLEVLL